MSEGLGTYFVVGSGRRWPPRRPSDAFEYRLRLYTEFVLKLSTVQSRAVRTFSPNIHGNCPVGLDSIQEPSLLGFALFALMVVSCPSTSPKRNFHLQVACGRRHVSGQPRCSSLRRRPTPASALCISFSTPSCRSCGCYRSCDWGTVVRRDSNAEQPPSPYPQWPSPPPPSP